VGNHSLSPKGRKGPPSRNSKRGKFRKQRKGKNEIFFNVKGPGKKRKRHLSLTQRKKGKLKDPWAPPDRREGKIQLLSKGGEDGAGPVAGPPRGKVRWVKQGGVGLGKHLV